MTVEDFEKAKELERLIKSTKDSKENLERLAVRVAEIMDRGTYFEGIKIKVNESWMCTPEGSVDIFDFADFLKKEIGCLNDIIATHEKEFAEL